MIWQKLLSTPFWEFLDAVCEQLKQRSVKCIAVFLLPFGSFLKKARDILGEIESWCTFLLPFGSFKKSLAGAITGLKADLTFYSLLGVSCAQPSALVLGSRTHFLLPFGSFVTTTVVTAVSTTTVTLSTPFWEFQTTLRLVTRARLC
jgi:hypothetical protein